MKALSLWQPWASLWCHGAKLHETRHWFISHRGPLAVHAAQKKPSSLDLSWELTERAQILLGVHNLDTLPLGALVGMVNVQGCRVITEQEELSADDKLFGNWQPGRFCILASAARRATKPLGLRGHQGLWNLNVSEWHQFERLMP